MAPPPEPLPAYLSWLSASSTVHQAGDWVVVTLPFLDRHNDHLQIAVRETGDGYHLSDDVYIRKDLDSAGLEPTPQRQELVEGTARRFGVRMHAGAIVAEAGAATLPQQFHAVLQAMLAIGHLRANTRKATESPFPMQVREYLKTLPLPVRQGVLVIGRSGRKHRFDYALLDAKGEPVYLIAAIGSPVRERLRKAVLSWNDVRARQPVGAGMFARIADAGWPPAPDRLELCAANGVRVIPWSQREAIAAGRDRGRGTDASE